MTPQDRQRAFFDEIRRNLHPTLLLVDEISNLLGVSDDSAYRRIGARKMLTMDELFTISKKYNISIDALFDLETDTALFKNWMINPDKLTIESWLIDITTQLEAAKKYKNKQLIYAAKDPPLYHFWNFPDVASFKIFFWKRSILQLPDYARRQFSFEEYNSNLNKIGTRMLDAATKIPIVEIWNENTFTTMLRQIEFYWIAGIFDHKEDVYRLCGEMIQWIRHLQEQAEKGFLFRQDMNDPLALSTYTLYENELILNNNTMLMVTDDVKTSYITYGGLNILSTNETGFSQSIYDYLQTLISNANQLSSIGSKERGRFFNRLSEEVSAFVKRF